jgi:hypothetical protein
VGLFTWSWYQIYLKIQSQGGHYIKIYALWLLGDMSYASGYAFPLALLPNDSTLKKLTEVTPMCVLGNCHCPVDICFYFANARRTMCIASYPTRRCFLYG